MKIFRKVDISFDQFGYWEGHEHLSVRTSEYDDFGRCKYQNLPLDGEARALIKQLSDWIENNLK
jgi:hypothetical protein